MALAVRVATKLPEESPGANPLRPVAAAAKPRQPIETAVLGEPPRADDDHGNPGDQPDTTQNAT
jgi:hypothetical protein